MTGIVILTVIVALLTAVITMIWWKVGDQWADDEYKKFGHGGGAPKGPPPTVIKDFSASSGPGSHADPAGSVMKTDPVHEEKKDS